MFHVLWNLEDKPLVTIGDAIASFLDRPDEKTAGCCLLSKKDLSRFNRRNIQRIPKDRFWRPTKYFWFSGPSLTRWLLCITLCMTALITAAILLRTSIKNLEVSNQDMTLSSLWAWGFGTISTDSVINVVSGLMASVLVANISQLIVSLLYFFYNGLFTSMLLADEWAKFAGQKRLLRVSSPEAGQRTTYWLELPYLYAVPMIAASTTLHWLISQSIFLARITVYYRGEVDNDASFTPCGYSCIATIFAIILGSIMVLACIINGFRLYRPGPPLVGSCSLAISAACHRPADDPYAARLPLIWGEVETDDGDEVGHCYFSSGEVKTPLVTRLYT